MKKYFNKAKFEDALNSLKEKINKGLFLFHEAEEILSEISKKQLKNSCLTEAKPLITPSERYADHRVRQFIKIGECWDIVLDEEHLHLRDKIGFHYYAYLLSRPNTPFKALNLFYIIQKRPLLLVDNKNNQEDTNPFQHESVSKKGPQYLDEIIDRETVRKFHERLKEIEEGLKDGQNISEDKHIRLEDEKTFILNELKNSKFFNSFKNKNEKFRQSISRSMLFALNAIKEHKNSRLIYDFLSFRIKRGQTFIYVPPDDILWETNI